jgi:3-hydroxyacyl-CoA dehydrogenase
VDAVAASLKPFEAGLKDERDGFMYLIGTPESRALRHAFLASALPARSPMCPKAPRCARSNALP